MQLVRWTGQAGSQVPRNAAASQSCPSGHLGLHAMRAPQAYAAPGSMVPAAAAAPASREKTVCHVVAPSTSPEDVDELVAVAPVDFIPAPTHLPRPNPVSIDEAPLGLHLYADGSATIRVWAPHCPSATLILSTTMTAPKAATPRPDVEAVGMDTGMNPDPTLQPDQAEASAKQGESVMVGLEWTNGIWGKVLPPGTIKPGQAYQIMLVSEDGRTLYRRDPYARQTDYASNWCYAVDPSAYEWKNTDWQQLEHDRYIIYEMQVGSFTPEGSFAAAQKKLKHLASLGITAVQLMPIAEHSDAWGYNPRQLLSLNGAYGTPADLCAFVDAAHAAGLAVIVDVVLHHGAPEGNALWEYDGWGPDNNGGIYHEGAPDTEWGRQLAFWKGEVIDMVTSACTMWLKEYRVDGLRFDSANDLPGHAIQAMTWALHDQFPGSLLTAEITPEDPRGVHELGFDALWVHSGYFDIIQQHKALGRGHHGGGDWAEGWNLPRLRTAMGLHYGFDSPTQCVKYMLGSHDQVGCRHGGKWYEDYKMIGGQHRYAVDQLGGGRTDSRATAAARCWWAANIAAAGLPMMFMGTEMAQSGWWDTDQWHGIQWANAEDEIGKGFMAAVRDANVLRAKYPALRKGWANTLHEDRPNGVMGYERVAEGLERLVVVVNAGRGSWQASEYGLWVGGTGVMEEVYCSQAPEYGGFDGVHSNTDVEIHDGRIYINLPPTCTIMLRHKSL